MALDFNKSVNSNKLQSVAKKSIESSNKVVAIDVPLTEIDKNEDNEVIFNMSDIEYLAKGIKEEGFFGAIEVYKKPDGRYEISSGHRRYEAMKYLKRDTIPCIVKELPDDLVRAKKLLSSNLRNRKLKPMEIARAIEYYQKALKEAKVKGDFSKQASEFFNMSEIQIYRFQCLLKLSDDLQELVNTEKIPYSFLQTAVSLSEKGQSVLYEKLNNFLNVESIDNEIKLTRYRIEQLISEIKVNEENQSRPNIEKKKKEKQIEKTNKTDRVEEKINTVEDSDNQEVKFEKKDLSNMSYMSLFGIYKDKISQINVDKLTNEEKEDMINILQSKIDEINQSMS